MSTAKTLQINSTSLEQTEQLGERLGQRLRGGEVIELVSDLGGGKTSFVRGLARGMGSKDHVASPTFTISREYKAGKLTLYHFDFYRLGDAGIMADELAEIVADPKAVTAIEWGEIVADVIPGDHVTVGIMQTGEESRSLTISFPPQLAYLME